MAEHGTLKNPREVWITFRSGTVLHSTGLGVLELITRAIGQGHEWVVWIDASGKEQMARISEIAHVGEISPSSGDSGCDIEGDDGF